MDIVEHKPTNTYRQTYFCQKYCQAGTCEIEKYEKAVTYGRRGMQKGNTEFGKLRLFSRNLVFCGRIVLKPSQITVREHVLRI